MILHCSEKERKCVRIWMDSRPTNSEKFNFNPAVVHGGENWALKLALQGNADTEWEEFPLEKSWNVHNSTQHSNLTSYCHSRRETEAGTEENFTEMLRAIRYISRQTQKG